MTIDSLSVFVGSRCDIKCRHCCAYDFSYCLNQTDFAFIYNAIKNLNINKIQFTGGEPSLFMDVIADFDLYLREHNSHVDFEIITNANFASSYADCCSVLGPFANIKSIIVSYDKFHATFVPLNNLINLKKYCDFKEIKISGCSVISEPSEIISVLNLENKTNIPFSYQKVAPFGRAVIDREDFRYDSLEYRTLKMKCPNINSIIYFPSIGFTHCCALFMNMSLKSRYVDISNLDHKEYFNSVFYKILKFNSFEKIISKYKINISNLTPECSHVCKLCEYVMGKVYARNNK